jgi:hypothetical protein
MHSLNKHSSLLQNSNFINKKVLYDWALDCIVSQATSNLVFFIITTVSCRHVRCRSALKPVIRNKTSSFSFRLQVNFVNVFENIKVAFTLAKHLQFCAAIMRPLLAKANLDVATKIGRFLIVWFIVCNL